MKCEQCGAKIEETFLNKPLGTLVKQPKKHWICSACQGKKSMPTTLEP